jgi:hypothetical protein
VDARGGDETVGGAGREGARRGGPAGMVDRARVLAHARWRRPGGPQPTWAVALYCSPGSYCLNGSNISNYSKFKKIQKLHLLFSKNL